MTFHFSIWRPLIVSSGRNSQKFSNGLRTLLVSLVAPWLSKFEAAFAEFCGTKYCVGVSNGADALRFALIAAGVKPGDVVITIPNTVIATAEAISQAGAEPRFVDIDERTYNMDPAKVREYLENSCTVDDKFGLVSTYSGPSVRCWT